MTAPRLAIGPANYAGQANTWAKAVERHLGVPADSFNRGPVRRHEFRFDTDREIPAPLFFAPLLRQARMKGFLKRYSHIAIDGYQTFYQVPQRRDLRADADFLRGAGFQVALIAHGTDVRRPDAHMERNPHSYFREGDEAYRERLRGISSRNNDAAEALGLPLFVSTPDLLEDQPGATWLPICLDPAPYRNQQPVLERAVPRVLHMPSRAVPPIKGTRFIEPVLRQLHDEGLLEYVTPPRMPHSEVPAFLQTVDVVVDQLLAASYGVTAIEAMAAGRVTVAGIGERTRGLMPADPPIVDATPENLEAVIRDVVTQRERYRDVAVQGERFVQQWHDGRHSANQLAPWLGTAVNPG